MPQTTLEYTTNITQKVDWNALLAEVHQTLVACVNTTLISCKTRVRRCDDFYIGDGSDNNAFVYLDVNILQGRDKADRIALSEALMETLKRYFAPSLQVLCCQLSVNVREIDAEIYSKFISA